VKTGYVSPALGAGQRPGATRIPFTIGDKIGAQVDVGSGNLLVTSTQFSLPRRSGSTLDVGLAYNSVTRTDQGNLDSTISDGWRLSTATDVRLTSVNGGRAVVYSGPNGLTGTFSSDDAVSYSPPAGFKMDLSRESNGGNGWKLADHDSGETRHFTADGRMTSLTDRNSNAETFTYNAAGQLTAIASDMGPAGAKTLSVSHPNATSPQITGFTQTPDSYSGLAARSVTYHYDPSSGYLTSITDILGRTTNFGYGANNNLNTITAPGGAQTSFGYDGLGRVQTVTQPTATAGTTAVTRFQYGAGQTLVADPNSTQSQSVSAAAHTTYALTDDGQLLVSSATDPAGKQRSASYTPFLDVDSATDATGQTTSSGHDANGGESLTGTTSPTGAGNSFAYGNSAAAKYQPSSGTDGQGNASTYTYDGAGNGLSAADAGNNKASVTRNGDGTVATSKTPSGAVTSYWYNTVGQQTSMTPPTGTSLAGRAYSYDGFGRLATLTDGRAITTTYGYDAGDRITAVTYSDSTHPVTYSYTTAGQVQTRTDASGTTTYGYDPLGRLTSRTNTANSGGVAYSYDKAGNLTTATNAAGTSHYTYNSREQLTAMTDPASRAIHFKSDDNGRRTDTWFNANTANTSFAAHTHTDYDESGRITEVWTSRNSNDATKVSDLAYGYGYDNDGGNCSSTLAADQDTTLRWVQHDVITDIYTNYCYDTSNRLILADPGAGDTFAYSYDADGNRTQITTDGSVTQTQTVNAADQLTTAGYSYDADGNTTADSHGTMTYNGAGQLTSLTDSQGAHAYSYAGTDQTEPITDPSGRNYTYGRQSNTGLPLVESFTQGGSSYSYLYDDTGTPLAIEGSLTHYLALDGLGSVVAAINHSGTATATYRYDPWGKQTTTPQNGSGISTFQLYGYAGGIPDPVTNLVHFGHRWYDTATGRFTQMDDFNATADPGRANRYAYAGENPINNVDPTGQTTCYYGAPIPYCTPGSSSTSRVDVNWKGLLEVSGVPTSCASATRLSTRYLDFAGLLTGAAAATVKVKPLAAALGIGAGIYGAAGLAIGFVQTYTC
jgi:RHS repeat-associated protein